MPFPTPPRGQDTIYWRRNSAGPGRTWGSLWTYEDSPRIRQARAALGMSSEQIRELGPPLPQIVRFPPRYGYKKTVPSMADIAVLPGRVIPYSPVSQDGGGALAISTPSNYVWW